MQKNELKKINAIITREVTKIRNYFNKLDNDEILFQEFTERINNELPAKIEYLTGVINATVLSLLVMGAVNTIENWLPANKNKYYDANIDKAISASIKAPEYIPYHSNTIRNFFLGSIIFVGGLTVIIGKTIGLKTITILLVFAALVLASKIITPRILAPHEKRKLIKHFEEYLKKLEFNYTKQVNAMAKEFCDNFDKIAKETGEA